MLIMFVDDLLQPNQSAPSRNLDRFGAARGAQLRAALSARADRFASAPAHPVISKARVGATTE
jgi:hypothetical protein